MDLVNFDKAEKAIEGAEDHAKTDLVPALEAALDRVLTGAVEHVQSVLTSTIAAAGDSLTESIDRAEALINSLDGWTVNINVPPITIPPIVITLKRKE